jgi:hypothetical protein
LNGTEARLTEAYKMAEERGDLTCPPDDCISPWDEGDD